MSYCSDTRLKSTPVFPRRSPVRLPLMLWIRNYRTRKALRRLDALGLNDIGVSHAQAKAEARKRFWQA